MHAINESEITPVCINKQSEFIIFDHIRDTFVYEAIENFIKKFTLSNSKIIQMKVFSFYSINLNLNLIF